MIGKWIFAAGMSAIAAWPSSACDICGCSSGAYFSGILPQFNRNFSGIRYTYRGFITSHPTSDASVLKSKDQFHTVDAWGRFYPHRRVQLFTVIPVNYITQTESGGTTSSIGLGDMQFYANYAIIQTPDSLESNWKHTLLAGGGLKLPTGENNYMRNGERLIQNLQPGSGSWDVLMNVIYTVRYKGWGLNLDANARINTTNNQGYRFGNRVNGSAKFFYWARYRHWSFLPNIGLLGDFGAQDSDKGIKIRETGGYSVLGTVGLDLYFKRLITGFTFQQPLAHQLADGAVKPLQRYSVSLSFLF
jgi:hypothetical protein